MENNEEKPQIRRKNIFAKVPGQPVVSDDSYRMQVKKNLSAFGEARFLRHQKHKKPTPYCLTFLLIKHHTFYLQTGILFLFVSISIVQMLFRRKSI